MLDLAQNSPPKIKIPTPPTIIVDPKYEPPNKNSSLLYITSTNNAACKNMSIDLNFVELTADVLKFFLYKILLHAVPW